MDDVTDKINSAFAEIAYGIFQAQPEYKGLYTSGRRCDRSCLQKIPDRRIISV